MQFEFEVVRTQKEIEEQYDAALEGRSIGTKFKGMTYEEGILAFIEWLTNPEAEGPMD